MSDRLHPVINSYRMVMIILVFIYYTTFGRMVIVQ